MARGDITIRHETRPCMVPTIQFKDHVGKKLEYVSTKAIWHGWYKDDDGYPWAMVEFEDGVMGRISYQNVRFVDNAFSEWQWPEEKDE